jgi:hypothetical protein
MKVIVVIVIISAVVFIVMVPPQISDSWKSLILLLDSSGT